MNPQRALFLSAIVSVVLCGHALAGYVEFDAPDGTRYRFYDAAPTIIVHQGTKPTPIAAGQTHLDPPRTIKCNSKRGCLITAKVWVSFDTHQGIASVSAYIDNVAMEPNVVYYQGQAILTAQQSTFVPTGIHTVATIVQQVDAGGEIVGWNAEYALYETPD